jgi:hypothetical protein
VNVGRNIQALPKKYVDSIFRETPTRVHKSLPRIPHSKYGIYSTDLEDWLWNNG